MNSPDHALPAYVAVPQSNGSDTHFLLSFLEQNPIRKVSHPADGEPTIFEGKVAIRYDYQLKGKFQKAPFDHPNISKAIELLKSWPEIYVQFGEIIREFQPMYLPDCNTSGQLGSMSHQPPATFGSMWATVNDPVCLAQAFVHELAHNKLFALGQQFESSGPLFLNPESELFDSPIRLDIPRPMSAIFHGVYAFTHVLSLNLKWLEADSLAGDERNYLLQLLNKNLNRVRIGLQLVLTCARPTSFGEQFVREAIAWAEKEITFAHKYMDKMDAIRSFLIIGPTGGGKSSFGILMARKTGKECVSLDTFCWDFWYSTPIMQSIFKKLFGESKLFLLNQSLQTGKKKELIADLFHKKIISEELFDELKLQLIYYTIRKFPGQIIDTGSGHCLFNSTKNLDRLKLLLFQSKIKVVQVRPAGSLEGTVDILKQRIEGRPFTDSLQQIKNSLLSPSYRTLSDYVVDTSTASNEECVDQFLALLGN